MAFMPVAPTPGDRPAAVSPPGTRGPKRRILPAMPQLVPAGLVPASLNPGGGSAGSVPANQLSAQSHRIVLLCEARQDTPEDNVPREFADSYPGVAYFDPRFHSLFGRPRARSADPSDLVGIAPMRPSPTQPP